MRANPAPKKAVRTSKVSYVPGNSFNNCSNSVREITKAIDM